MKIRRYFSAVLHVKQRKHYEEGLHLKKTVKLNLICTRLGYKLTCWTASTNRGMFAAPQRHNFSLLRNHLSTHPSSDTLILSQRKELYKNLFDSVCKAYVSSRSLLILCNTALKVEGQIIAADQNSLPKLLLKLLHIRFNARQIESLQAKKHTQSLKSVAYTVI